jgi:hypothetical protein
MGWPAVASITPITQPAGMLLASLSLMPLL